MDPVIHQAQLEWCTFKQGRKPWLFFLSENEYVQTFIFLSCEMNSAMNIL